MKLLVCMLLYVASISVVYADDVSATLKDVITKVPVAASVGTIGTGASDVLSGTAEKNIDAKHNRDMSAYEATFTCRITGSDKITKFNESGVIPPVNESFLAIRNEYIAAAEELKVAKQMLEMKPGIESDEIISDISGLYENAPGADIVHMFDEFDNPDEKIEQGMDNLRIGIVTSLASTVVGGVINSDGVANNQEQTTYLPKEEQKENTNDQCPAKYCQGGSEYTDEETCRAWTICGCADGPSSAEVCSTPEGQELCECEQ